MKLHIFNPEHEIALAMNKDCFTPSHNVVKMRRELAFMPVLWADDGDMVLVEDIEYAYKAADKLAPYIYKDVRFVGFNRMRSIIREKIQRRHFDLMPAPWGWDKTVLHLFKSLGWPAERLPSEEFIDQVGKSLTVVRQSSSSSMSLLTLLPSRLPPSTNFSSLLRSMARWC